MSDTTESVIASMLTENTGTHFLDSGGYSGRHWQRNQGRDFASEPRATLSVGSWGRGKDRNVEVSITLNVYHFLVNNLDYAAELDAKLSKIVDDSDWSTTYDECIDLFFKSLRDDKHEVAGPEGSGKPSGDYTYNYDNLLSQDIVYTYFDLDDEPYVILQIHGGADARGGFTAPRVFSLYEPYGLSFSGDASVYCNECHTYWDTDDAYHLYHEGSSGDSVYDLAGMIPLDVNEYDPDDASMMESRIMRFGYEFYVRWADREDRLRDLIAHVRSAPKRLIQRVIIWAGTSSTDKRKATLIIRHWGYSWKKFDVRWHYPVKHTTILKIARWINGKVRAYPPRYAKRVLLIDDYKATCPVCGKGTLGASPIHY